jgi:hypothetical protein
LARRAGQAASTVGASLEEAALTTKIKAKMALDDVVESTLDRCDDARYHRHVERYR